jgi:5-methylcytosine-specific restriction enzyme A
MSSDPLRFDSGDEPFLKWLQENPRGYVINARRNEEQGAAMIHKAQCAHIRSLRNSERSGGFTTRNWIKYAGTDLHRLVHHFVSERKAPLIIISRCRSCDAVPRDLYHERPPHEPLGVSEEHTLTIRVNARERDPLARAQCIARHGLRCIACGVDLAHRYGQLAEEFIEVHELPSSDPRAEFDPQRDLVPVCPNCHSMLHRGRQTPLSIAELQGVLRRAVRTWSDSVFGG